ncbi:MAG: hypothetical protein GW839_02400 [Flavobacteriales bacterium]|nr:hypothetical protein [Flavobacteriia bacterium]NCP04913.1 hypothetical protein [Flavobacteriales bacterium]PIV95209.1 MAG: hypothetical protein COW44_00120 [Flavobacteriaceae bacterium CG17_big_fil_post_rev_8_21_14_2_50_33_15]PIY11711.1 MAG: hypothetical protein COZ17_06030 [Flavobacteriaceae bacterium CG_4_10_14_3_um_filter_33_47]PJB16960.1 MAG: hypothetical protein CO117_13510 [Flavobacteriaceae bacterium CG_4_9_14_3_um_filter_33_16]
MKWIQKVGFKNKALLLGFVISLLGTLPLGYLNVIGLQILFEQGHLALTIYIIGILVVEFFVLLIVSYMAKWLVQQKKLLLFVDIFTILFFASIAWYFVTNISSDSNFTLSQLQMAKYPFVLGVILNSLNLIQWPYWSGIYMYVFRTEKLNTTRTSNYLFITGALAGTFLGMLIFIYTGNYILEQSQAPWTTYLNPMFATLFFVLATLQIIKLIFRKNNIAKEFL